MTKPVVQGPSLQQSSPTRADIQRIPLKKARPFSPWLPLSVGGGCGLLFSRRLREMYLTKKLRSNNIDTVLSTIQNLSLSPRSAHLLLERWAYEWERVQNQQIDTKTTQPVLKALQKSIDRLQHRTSMQWGWQRINWRDQCPALLQRFYRLTSRWVDWDDQRRKDWETHLHAWARIPFHSQQGARLEHKTLPLALGPIRLRNAHLNDAHLQHIGLQGADLRGTHMEGADFNNAQLERASFYQAKGDRVRMDNAELRDSAFVGSTLRHGSFVNSTLDNADFRHADLRDAHFFQSSLARVNGSHVKAIRTSFLYADMRESVWEGANLRESECSHAWAKRCNFSGTDFTKANCASADFSSSNFHDADCALMNAYEADLRWCNLTGIHWSGMCLMDANLMTCSATTEFLSYAHAQEALLDEEQFQRVMLWNDQHPDAPWLQDDWSFWWEDIEWENGIDWRDPGFLFEDYAYPIQCELHELQMYFHPTF